MNTLEPKTVAPGWARRWTRQSVELFRRAPVVAIGTIVLFLLINVFFPLYALCAPISVFMVGLLFSSLRAADLNSGHALEATWMFFRQAAKDLTYLAIAAFLALLASGVPVLLFAGLGMAATHGVHAPKLDPDSPAYLALPHWLRYGTNMSGLSLMTGIFFPSAIPIIFLTMSVGTKLGQHWYTGMTAVVLNLRMAGTISLIGMLAGSLLSPLLHAIPSLTLGCAIMAGFAAAFWWFGAWGYLWCREMFEGTMENAKETARQQVPVSTAA